jgi:hypothetical protein
MKTQTSQSQPEAEEPQTFRLGISATPPTLTVDADGGGMELAHGDAKVSLSWLEAAQLSRALTRVFKGKEDIPELDDVSREPEPAPGE